MSFSMPTRSGSMSILIRFEFDSMTVSISIQVSIVFVDCISHLRRLGSDVLSTRFRGRFEINSALCAMSVLIVVGCDSMAVSISIPCRSDFDL